MRRIGSRGRDGAITRVAIVVVVAVGCLLAAAAARADSSVVVSTSAGWVRGSPRSGGGAQFLGIPYAEPPVGPLRWRAPVAARHWSGIRDATAFGAPCAQPVLGDWNWRAAHASREDCLYLNVIVPEWPLKKRLPVMFWIHGGANEGGEGGGSLYNSGTLVSHGVVLVTINYRLGIFGFLAHPALTRESSHHASGDYGLMDQILALHWVRENIARFGGDPHDITAFGQSAGSFDVGLLMASRGGRLFQKAIEESGSPFGVSTLAEAERAGVALAAALRVPPGDAAIARLRKISAADLIGRVAALPRAQSLQPPGPDIDGWVVNESPTSVFAAGRESPIPLMFGTTTRELDDQASTSELRPIIEQQAGPLAGEVLAVYGLDRGARSNTDPKYGNAGEQIGADFSFRCPALIEADWHTAAGHVTYEYELDHAIPGHPFAVHSGELPYVFGFFPKTGNLAGHFTATDQRLAELMQAYWTNFAKTGDPNSGDVPKWPPFGATRRYIQFLQDGRVAVDHDLRSAQCGLYRKVFMAGLGTQGG